MILTIIADDLTGSNDSGVQFAKKGLNSSVYFDIDQINLNDTDSDVVIFDTDSRGETKEEAYNRVKKVAAQLKSYPFKYLYKKIDSTLRGNIGIELDAIMDVFQKDFAIITPAYPAIGRTTRNGNHYLHGERIDKTEIAKDPKAPVTDSNVEKILQSQSTRKTATVYLEDVREGKAHLHSLLNQYKSEGINYLVFDVEVESDLDQIVSSVVSSAHDVLWVGSAGLAEHLVHVIKIENSLKDLSFKGKEGNVILVAGSLSQATKGQIDYMRERQGIKHIELNPTVLFDESTRAMEIKRCKSLIVEEINAGNDIVLYSGTNKEQIAKAIENGLKIGLNKIQVSNEIAKVLGEIVSDIIDKVKISGLVLTGGDTAKAVSRHIGVTGMKLIKELETGIPIGYLIGDYEIPAITKAGAFGTSEALFSARNLLKGDA